MTSGSGRTDVADCLCSDHAGGLPPDANETQLAHAFSVFGPVIEVHMPREGGKEAVEANPNAPHRGFAFIVLASAQAAEDAIDNMHLNEWGSKILNVNFARPLGSTFNSHRPVWQDEVRISSLPSIMRPSLPSIMRSRSTDRAFWHTGMDRQVRRELDAPRGCAAARRRGGANSRPAQLSPPRRGGMSGIPPSCSRHRERERERAKRSPFCSGSAGPLGGANACGTQLSCGRRCAEQRAQDCRTAGRGDAQSVRRPQSTDSSADPPRARRRRRSPDNEAQHQLTAPPRPPSGHHISNVHSCGTAPDAAQPPARTTATAAAVTAPVPRERASWRACERLSAARRPTPSRACF